MYSFRKKNHQKITQRKNHSKKSPKRIVDKLHGVNIGESVIKKIYI